MNKGEQNEKNEQERHHQESRRDNTYGNSGYPGDRCISILL